MSITDKDREAAEKYFEDYFNNKEIDQMPISNSFLAGIKYERERVKDESFRSFDAWASVYINPNGSTEDAVNKIRFEHHFKECWNFAYASRQAEIDELRRKIETQQEIIEAQKSWRGPYEKVEDIYEERLRRLKEMADRMAKSIRNSIDGFKWVTVEATDALKEYEQFKKERE